MGRKTTTNDSKTSADETGAKPASTRRQRGSARRAAAASPEERWRLIAEAAYYRAQARGFQGGNAADDWTAAEGEIDRRLAGDPRQDEQAAYDRLRAEVQKRLAAVKGSVDAKTVQDAIERATARAKQVRTHAAASVNKAAERLKKDMGERTASMGPRWVAFSDKTSGAFAVWRDRGGVFASRAATAAGTWLNRAARRFERPQYRAGEAVSRGSFQCGRCGSLLHMEAPGRLPSCQACQHTEFRRIP